MVKAEMSAFLTVGGSIGTKRGILAQIKLRSFVM